MASVDMLTEVEIRKKMAEYGINIPFTDSTRKIILLSLKKRMEEKKPASNNLNSNRPNDRRSTALFSSGEDSGDDLNENQKSKMLPPSSSQRKTRRQTIGVVSPPTNTNTSTKSRRSEFAHIIPTISVPIPVSEPKKRVGRSSMFAVQRQTPSISTDEYDAGSDSDVPISKFGSRDSKTPTIDKMRPDVMASSSRLATVQSAFVLEQNEARETNGDKSVSSLLSFRKHTTSKVKPNETKSRPSDELSSPFLSDFARRLSQQAGRESRTFGSSTPRTSELFKVKKSDIGDDYIAASTSRSPQNGHFFPAQASTSGGGVLPRDLSREFKTTEDAPGFWTSSHVKSMVVLLVFFVFFGALAAAYFSVRANEVVNFSADNQRNVFPICLPPDDVRESPDPCIPANDLVPAISLVKHVHPELKRRAILAACGPPRRDGSYVSPVMTERAVAEWLADQYEDADHMTQTNLRNLKKLLLANPHWGIAVVAPAPAAPGTTAAALGSQDARDQLVRGGGLAAQDVALPLACYARRAAATMAWSCAVVVAGFLAVYAGQRAVAWWMRRRASARQEVYTLVQRALELVQAHHLGAANSSSPGGGAAAAYLAVNHVRDQLIEPRDRYRMAGSWSEAVAFIEANESRVRSEVQQVCGEECPVWRWLPPPPPSPLGPAASPPGMQTPPPAATTTSISLSGLDTQHPNRVKVWLGQAFPTEPGAQNGAPRSPTNCLKIRHMFDDIEYGDDWPQKVKDALLEKCGEGVNVLYLVVDRRSTEGCVYMKCATNDDAGVAYRALHGWWFDSKLVTVKYIRLERYHERFPEAVTARTPLRPSNDKKLSLSEDLWPSATLEAN